MTDTPIKTVLLVEDEEQYGDVVKQLHSCVQKLFYDQCFLTVSPSWSDAIERIRANPPDCVVLDLTLLPSMRPDDTLEALFACWHTLPPVVVLTGSEDPGMRRRAILAGADSFQTKLEFNRHPELLCEKIYEAFLRRLRNERA